MDLNKIYDLELELHLGLGWGNSISVGVGVGVGVGRNISLFLWITMLQYPMLLLLSCIIIFRYDNNPNPLTPEVIKRCLHEEPSPKFRHFFIFYCCFFKNPLFGVHFSYYSGTPNFHIRLCRKYFNFKDFPGNGISF